MKLTAGRPRHTCEITMPLAKAIIERMNERGLQWHDIEDWCEMPRGTLYPAWLGDKLLSQRRFNAVMSFLEIE